MPPTAPTPRPTFACFSTSCSAPASSTPDVKPASRKKAESTLARVRKGANFGQLAAQLSEDPGSRADRASFRLDPGAFRAGVRQRRLGPQAGETTGLVETPFGFHIIKRPALAEVRPRFKDYLAQQAGSPTRLDVHGQSRHEGPHQGGDQCARDDLRRHGRAGDGEERHGADSLRAHALDRALPPHYTAQPPPTTAPFRGLPHPPHAEPRRCSATRTLRGSPSRPGGVGELRQRYLAQLDTLKLEMGLDSNSLGGSSVRPEIASGPPDSRLRVISTS